MASRYDTESMLRDIETKFKANLNSEIAIINAEKGDFTIPDIVTPDAWYLQYLPRTFSYKNFLMWGIESSTITDSQPGNRISTHKFFLEVVVSDGGEKQTDAILYSLLRYTRALEEVARKNSDMFQGRAKAKVEALTPTSFPINGKLYRSAGIRIEASLNAF